MSSPASFAVIARRVASRAVLLAELPQALPRPDRRARGPRSASSSGRRCWTGPARSPFISGVADFGLAFLMFMAGYEIDFQRVRGAPLDRARPCRGSSRSARRCWSARSSRTTAGEVSDLLIGLVLTTTSMGALIPILDDAGVADKPFGAFAFGAGALGEFAPIVAITRPAHRRQPVVRGRSGSARSWSSRSRSCSSRAARHRRRSTR